MLAQETKIFRPPRCQSKSVGPRQPLCRTTKGKRVAMRTRRRPVSRPASSRPPPRGAPSGANRLLAALPSDDYARIAPLFDHISLKLKQIIHRAGDPVRHIYFPGSGFCSVLSVLEDGKMVEVATV